MSIAAVPIIDETIEYPESDGAPLGENTDQVEWIIWVFLGIDDVFQDDANVFVATDLFWYPVEGNPGIRSAPDTMVAFGRPKGFRRSYLQWREAHIAPQVTFEVQSPSNTKRDLKETLAYYDRFQVEEYYLLDPATQRAKGWRRIDGKLRPIAMMKGWISPRLRVTFDWTADGNLMLISPNGQPFPTRRERQVMNRQAEQLREELGEAKRRTSEAEHEAERMRHEAERLKAQLRAAGIDPDAAT